MPARSRHVEEYVLLSPPMICTYRIQGEDRAPFQQVILVRVVFRHSSPLGGHWLNAVCLAWCASNV